MSRTWRDSQFGIGMPHMVPGKLSEVELLKLLGDYQWDSISALLDQRPSEIATASNERLYSSFINIELHFSEAQGQHTFGEGDRVFVRNGVGIFANKFVEGFTLFGPAPIAPDVTDAIVTAGDLRKLDHGWAYLTNAFVTRAASNSRLKVFEPAQMSTRQLPKLATVPPGFQEHEAVQFSGEIEPTATGQALPIPAGSEETIDYPIVPESDLNGAGLFYFARYVAVMNYAERVFLTTRARPRWSRQLVNALSTRHRKIYYFGNAEPSDTLRVSVAAHLLLEPALDARPRTLLLRFDLHRQSDNVLIASSLAQKSIHLGGGEKALLAEWERLLKSLESSARPVELSSRRDQGGGSR